MAINRQALKGLGVLAGTAGLTVAAPYGLGRWVGKRKAKRGITISPGGQMGRSMIPGLGLPYAIGVAGGMKRHGGVVAFRKRKKARR